MAAETNSESKKSRKKTKEKQDNSFLSGIRTYVGEVRTELNKVSWPDRPDVIRLLWIVLITTVVSGIVLGLMAAGFTILVEEGIKFPIIFVVIFVAIVGITAYMFQRDNQKTGY